MKRLGQTPAANMIVGKKKSANVIEPNRCIVEDLEILAFDNEEQMNFYTFWHESLTDRRRVINAANIRERQIIRNEIARKTRKLIEIVGQDDHNEPSNQISANQNNRVESRVKVGAHQDQRQAQGSSNDAGNQISNSQHNRSTSRFKNGASNHQCQGSATLPNGLAVITSQVGDKQVLRYKLTKMYSKYRGRQERRNQVYAKQVQARIDAEVQKSYLNPWLAYTALQALQLPMHLQPRHLIYIDPGNIITYSNRINPQQVTDYKQRSQRLPTSTLSKKSSAASYDVYEIMKVLANSDKTNVTITRNSNRPNQAGNPNASVYSQSVNANIPGIVSTQLHIQARSYLDMMRKFYAEERQRLVRESEAIDTMTDDEEDIISKYIKMDPLPHDRPDYQASTIPL